jgi:hypothetical protein
MFTSCVLSYIRTSPVLCSSIVIGEHIHEFKLCSPCVCSHFHKWGASRAGEDRTLENSDDALYAVAIAECVISREQVRLRLLELIREFRSIFGHWSYAEIPKHEGRVAAVERAMRVMDAVLEDDEEQMILGLDALAFHLGYRIKEGRFDD